MACWRCCVTTEVTPIEPMSGRSGSEVDTLWSDMVRCLRRRAPVEELAGLVELAVEHRDALARREDLNRCLHNGLYRYTMYELICVDGATLAHVELASRWLDTGAAMVSPDRYANNLLRRHVHEPERLRVVLRDAQHRGALHEFLNDVRSVSANGVPRRSTVLDVAIEDGHLESAELLKAAGALTHLEVAAQDRARRQQ
jgi:hypothetical protein